jgi:multidrug transporter EmrE-like cation transporter
MKIGMVAAIVTSVLLSSTAQILMKQGMTEARVAKAITAHDPVRLATTVATSVGVVGGLFSFGLSIVLWLYVLSTVPLSTAYPFVALGICITSLAGYLLFGDSITVTKLGGVAAIVLGIGLIATAK